MTEEETSEQADRASAALRDTILQLADDGADPRCIIEALIMQAVGLAFAQDGRREGQHLVEGTMNAYFRKAAMMAPRAKPPHSPAGDSVFVELLKKKQASQKIEPREIAPPYRAAAFSWVKATEPL